MPTSESLADIASGAGVAQSSISQGMQLAQASQQMEVQKQQVAKMQDELDTSKFNKLNGYMQTLARSRPEVAKRMLPTMQSSLQKSGIAVDPGILQLMASDDDYKRRMMSMSQTADTLANDPAARSQFLQAHQDVGSYDKGLDQLEHYSKQQSQLDAATNRADMMERVANINAKGKVDAATVGGQRYQNRLAFQTHKAALGDVNNDKITNDLQVGYQNLSNSLTNFQASDRNPEEFAQLQQSLRANAGIKGSSTGSERADSYLHDYGISAQQFLQKLSGDPQDIMKTSPKFVDLVAKIADAELDNKRKQAKGQIDRKSVGYKSFYSDPDNAHFAEDFNNVVKQRYHQFGITADGAPSADAPASARDTVGTGAQAPARTAALSGNAKAALADLITKTHDPAQIQRVLAKAGHQVSPQDIEAALGKVAGN